MRKPIQVLVFPYRKRKDQEYEFCIFFRKKMNIWQGIAGGGEDDETPLETAIREVHEETGISETAKFFQLSAISSTPVVNITGQFTWGPEVYVVTEYSFGVDATGQDIILSDEHKEYKWVSYKEAMELLNWDSNRTALWELNTRLEKNDMS